jgi:sulfate permease, SulP family
MHPRVVILSRHADGTLRDARLFSLPTSEYIIAMRFDGSLYFANVPYFEDALLEEAARHPKAQYILVVSEAINEIDGSGEEVIRHLVARLQERGLTMVFSGMKLQVREVLRRTGLETAIGTENFFNTEDAALDAIFTRISDDNFDAAACPLRRHTVA